MNASTEQNRKLGDACACAPRLVCLTLHSHCRHAGHSPGLDAALRLMAAPYFGAACLYPHAVLLYWLAHGASTLVLQSAARGAVAAKALGVPWELFAPASAESERDARYVDASRRGAALLAACTCVACGMAHDVTGVPSTA